MNKMLSERELSQECFKINQDVKAKTIANKTLNSKIKGFSANSHNYGRTKNVYSLAENIFKDKLLNSGLSKEHWIHEYPIQVKDVSGKSHTYHIDFYFPKQRLAVEINPMFHYNYAPVALRDQLRAKILSRYGIKTLDIKVNIRQLPHSQITSLDKADVVRAIKLLRSLKNQPNSGVLDHYITNHRVTPISKAVTSFPIKNCDKRVN